MVFFDCLKNIRPPRNSPNVCCATGIGRLLRNINVKKIQISSSTRFTVEEKLFFFNNIVIFEYYLISVWHKYTDIPKIIILILLEDGL